MRSKNCKEHTKIYSGSVKSDLRPLPGASPPGIALIPIVTLLLFQQQGGEAFTNSFHLHRWGREPNSFRFLQKRAENPTPFASSKSWQRTPVLRRNQPPRTTKEQGRRAEMTTTNPCLEQPL